MALKYLTDIDLNQNELQNGVIQNVSGNVSTPKAGQFWFDSSNGVKKLKYYDGTNTLIIGESSISSNSTSQSVPTTQAVAEYIGNAIAASDAMIFKGTLGTGGTITALPTTYETGWTYRIITAGTYAGQSCEVGDLIIAIVDRSGSGNLDSDWTVAQTNIGGAGTATPLMDGTAAVGTSTSYAREDHVHPSDTSRVPTTTTVNGHALSSNVEVTNTDLGQGYGTCTAEGGTVTLPVTLSGYVKKTGGIVAVKFTNDVYSSDGTSPVQLNINSTGAAQILYRGMALYGSVIKAGNVAYFMYDGTYYVYLGRDNELSVSGYTKRYTTTSPALTPSSGVATWTVSHGLGSAGVIISVYETASGKQVMADITVTSSTSATIKISTTSTIIANTFRVVVIG